MRATIIRAACTMLAFCDTIGAQNFRPDIPKAWDDAGVARFETPLAQRDRSPRYLSAKDYYALKFARFIALIRCMRLAASLLATSNP
jgi:hypothetical protein